MRANRRGFLRGLAAGLSAVTVGTSAATAARDDLPATVRGTRVHEYRPDGETYTHTERFESEELARRYGTRVLEYDRAPVPRDAIPEAVRSRAEPLVLRSTETTLVGRFREFARYERQKRKTVTTQSPGDWYVGPIYHYNSSVSNPDPDDLGEPKGPINVVWNDDVIVGAQNVREYMYDNLGWGGYLEDPVFKEPRYIVYDVDYQNDPVVDDTDAHAAKDIFFSEQWHVRLYGIPYGVDDDYGVIGQAHYDPPLHDGPPWDFDDARAEVLSDWSSDGKSTATQYVGNGGPFGTADGYTGRIHQ